MAKTVAFWNFVADEERTEECPEYLRSLSDKDKRILGSWDADFKTIAWDGEDGVRDLVGELRYSSYLRYASCPMTSPPFQLSSR
jgi:hypothetical protein